MTRYCGVDFHARQRAVCYYDMAGGEIRLKELNHGKDYADAKPRDE
jgi:hypothetical protein